MDIQRSIIWIGLAIVSYLMILAWNADYHTPVTEPIATAISGKPATTKTEKLVNPATPISENDNNEFATPEEQTTGLATPDEQTQVISTAGSFEVRTDVLDLRISKNGGNLIQAELLGYAEQAGSSRALTLLQNNAQHSYILESGLIGRDGPDNRRNGPAPRYSSEKDQWALKDGEDTLTLNLHHTTPQGINIIKRYVFTRGQYQVDVNYLIENTSDKTWQGNFAGKIVRDNSPDPTSQSGMGMQSFLGLVMNSPTNPYEKLTLSDLAEKPVNTTVQGGWLAFLQHYFLTAWIPPADQNNQFQSTRRGNLSVMGFVAPVVSVEPGQKGETSARLYLGPKLLDQLENTAPNLDRTIDYGFLFFVALPLFWILDMFHGLFSNWGVAIIMLTVVVKAAFFWLSAASYRSMAKMRAVGPQLARLKELYGDDRQRMSQEMMNLYKKEKINPLGGCLPILVQMPVFIALYWVLFESVQLRHAPFFGWIQDLAVMDPYFILPLLMGGTMFIQMQLNPTPPDPVQAKVMKLMPIIFTVFFLWFPSGLVLYWLVNNILSISQQWYITRQIEQEAAHSK